MARAFVTPMQALSGQVHTQCNDEKLVGKLKNSQVQRSYLLSLGADKLQCHFCVVAALEAKCVKTLRSARSYEHSPIARLDKTCL